MKTPLATKEQVLALPVPDDGQALFWDEGPAALPGFGVRVTANGKRAYIVQARVGGMSRRKVVGDVRLINLAPAKTKALGMLASMKVDKVDLTAAERTAATAARAHRVQTAAFAWTLREVAAMYVKERDLRDSTRRELSRHVEKNFGDYAEQPIARITVSMVKARFAKLTARAPAQAKQAMGVLRSLCSFARDTAAEQAGGDTFPLLAVNPVTVGLKLKLKPNEGRETMVPLNKVRAVWAMLTGHRAAALLDSPARTGLDMVCFGLLTGCRLGEAQNLTFDLLDLDAGWWKIEADIAKDGKARTLPLSTAAVELLRQREARPGNRYVFPSRTIAGRDHFKRPDKALAQVSELAGMHLSFHDLRRTWQSVADECGVPDWRSALLSSHKPQSVTGRHYRQKYDVRYLAADAELIGSWITATSA